MTPARPAEQKQQGKGVQGLKDRLVNRPKTLLSTLWPHHSSLTDLSGDRTKPLHRLNESVVTVWYALYFSLDIAPCWAGGVSEHR